MEITPELKLKIEEYKRVCTENLYNGKEWENYKPENTEKYVDYVYNFAGFKLPAVIIANTISEYKELFNQIFTFGNYDEIINDIYVRKNGTPAEIAALKVPVKGTNTGSYKQPDSHYLYLISEYSRTYLMWYKFLKDELNMKCSKAAELDWLYDNVRQSSIAKGYFTDKCCLILRMPKKIFRNDVGFHNPDGYAIDYGTEGWYYLNGREVKKDIFERIVNNTFSLADYMKLKNDEDKGSVISLLKERGGPEALKEFLGAELIDEKVIKHSETYSETLKLWKSKLKFPFARNKRGEENQPLAWFEEKCPSTGQTYLLETWPDFKDVEEAAKFHRPSVIPRDIVYNWELFAN